MQKISDFSKRQAKKVSIETKGDKIVHYVLGNFRSQLLQKIKDFVRVI